MDNFKSFSFPPSLQKSLEKLKLDKPTEVQVQAIPQVLEGKDMIISAPTGTGKTLAFSIPVIQKLLADKTHGVVVITPTRELAAQILEVVKSLLQYSKEIKPVLLIGGMPIGKQLMQLKAKPQLIIGTPGRINDHLERKSLRLDNTKSVILDEMDLMLDMGFSIQIDRIFKFLPERKQVLMLSATIPPDTIRVSKKYLNNPAKVTINPAEIVNTDINQDFVHTSKDQKYKDLLGQLSRRDGTKIIFVKTRRNTEELAKKLNKDSFKAKSIHGGLKQNQRDKVIKLFRKGACSIVVATDVAARGIDVPHIKHVINYNLPANPEDYVHRVGRTGRAGQEGHSLCFILPNERREWRALEAFLNPDSAAAKSKGSSGKNSPRRRKFGKPGGKMNNNARSLPSSFRKRRRKKPEFGIKKSKS